MLKSDMRQHEAALGVVMYSREQFETPKPTCSSCLVNLPRFLLTSNTRHVAHRCLKPFLEK